MEILLVEDDAETADYIVSDLRGAGHVLAHAGDGDKGLELAEGRRYDLLIVDRMLPGTLDGWSLVRIIRARGDNTPVLFLSNLDGIDNRVAGLEVGDDYLTKPFAMPELLARINAIFRRSVVARGDVVLTVGDLRMDLLARTVKRGETAIDLLPREWQLLEYLMRNANHVVTRSMLLHDVWGFHFDPQTNVVETHISRLRQKVDKGFGHDLIHTVRGTGYTISAAC